LNTNNSTIHFSMPISPQSESFRLLK